MSKRIQTSAKNKTWNEKVLVKRYPKRVVIDAPFAGIPAGSTLFVGTPLILQRYICKIPSGQVRTIERMRRDIARSHRCAAMCPVSTAIFLRMIAESAWEEVLAGVANNQVTPFWRVIEPSSVIAKKLRASSAWIKQQRESESAPS